MVRQLCCLASCLAVRRPPQPYTEERVAKDLQAIHTQLGTTHDELWNEISNSSEYSQEQASNLKRRIGELVAAYEELWVDAECHEHHFPSCRELNTAGLRFNSTILDVDHSNLPSLPPIPKGHHFN